MSTPPVLSLPDSLSRLRQFPLDGALLLFDRDSGLNALCDGVETTHFRQIAPRAVQFGITNSCNLACAFCSRDVTAKNGWTSDEAFTVLADLANAGVLEVAFGGGEPWTFPGFAELVRRLYNETPLAVSFTTNGLLMTPERLASIRGCFGQIRLSIYDNNDWRQRVMELVNGQARFGINYLITPARLIEFESTVLELCALGCRDILLLSYNGDDASMHLSAAEAKALSARVGILAKALAGKCQIKLDVCWGERMEGVPRLFDRQDCGAGRDFIVITSDRQMQPCSFHDFSIPISSAEDIMSAWQNRQQELGKASSIPGCARISNYGLTLSRYA
jgi:MoaA/NifB/PqqE/SkfB family radical SAM enzyme